MIFSTLYEASGLRKLTGTARFGLLSLTMGLSAFSQTVTSDAQYVLNQVTAPVGIVRIRTATTNDYWVADHLRGFCRYAKLSAAAPFTLDPATCLTGGPTAVGKPHWDSDNNFLYIPDLSSASRGVWRYTYTPATRRFGTPRLMGTNGGGLGAQRPHTVALGPDGSLYVGTLRNANIYRITTPGASAQTVTIVGSTNDAISPVDIAFVGANLWIAQSASISRVNAIRTCTSTARCVAAPTNTRVTAPTAIVGLTGRVVFTDVLAGAAFIHNYDIAADRQDIWSQTLIPNGGTTPLPYPGITGLSRGVSEILIGADLVEGPALAGNVYSLAATAPFAVPGTPGVPPAPAIPAGLVSANFANEGVTLPAGAITLGSTAANKSVWVSDHLFGFCRLDPVAASSPIRYTINQTTCVVNAISPGQPVYHAGTRTVFVPDNSSRSTGVWRYTYNLTSKLLGSPVRLGASAFAGVRPTTLAISGTNVFVGSITSPLIRKIVNATTATAAATTGAANVALNVPIVGRTSNGLGINALAISEGTLYVGQLEGLESLPNANTAPAGVQTSTTPVAANWNILDVQALLAPAAGKLLVASSLGVYSINLAVAGSTPVLLTSKGIGRIPGVATPEQLYLISGLGLNIAGDLVIGDDPYLGDFAAFGRLWTIPAGQF